MSNVAIAPRVTLTTAPSATMVIDADFVGPGSVVVARDSVTLGRGSKLAEGVTVRDANHDMAYPLSAGKFITAPVVIGDEVWIAAKATVLAGVTIHSGSTVGAGAVVTRDVPAGSTVVGVPARVI